MILLYGFLGMDFDKSRCKKEKIDIDRFNRLTWENAISAARRFSGGRACSKGQGTKLVSKNFQFDVGHGEGVDTLPPFLIIENVDGMTRGRRRYSVLGGNHTRTEFTVWWSSS